MKRGKNYKKAIELFEKTKKYPIQEALEIMEKFPKAKFDESVEIHIRTTINPKKSDQLIRGATELPHGTGKSLRIAAFTEKQQKEAKQAGADIVGGEELVEKMGVAKSFDFDVAVATPEMMPKLAKIAKILGPKGLMPNPKSQTVGPKIAEMISALKKGRASYKNDDGANIHMIIGKRSFGNEKIADNARAFLEDIRKNKPAAAKGKLIKNISISFTMSPGVKINL